MNKDTLLYRQIHPDFVQLDRQRQSLRSTSQAFYPSREDNTISVYDGGRISAADSLKHYIQVEKLESLGVMAITPAECTQLKLPVVPDGKGFPEHVSIDCSALTTRGQVERNAKQLRNFANARGWQFGLVY